MLRFITLTFLIGSVSLLSACSGEQDTPPPMPTTMSEDNVFKGQVDALQKAKGVEATIQGSFDRQRQHIDQQ